MKKLRELWPIETSEFKKFFPMALMFVCVLFNYNVLRSIKDGLLVTHIGAEAISFTKMYGTLPGAVLFAIIYAKMTSVLNQKQIFYSFCTFFLAFFMIFGFVIYPNQAFFHPDAQKLELISKGSMSIFGVYDLHLSHFKWFLRIFSKWSYALFYIFAELWGSIMLTFAFWQFCNSITKTEEAKRFYPMIGFVGNIALILGGLMLMSLTDGADILNEKVKASTSNEESLISSVTWAVSITTGILMGLYAYLNNCVLTDPQFMPDGAKKKKKIKMTMTEGLKFVLSSKYLGLIAMLLICYGVSINLVEGPWKYAIKQIYPTTVSYTGFMAKLQLYTGAFTMLAFFIAAQVLRRISWFTGAILTPIMIAFTGVGFFVFLALNKSISSGVFGTFLMAFDPLYLATIFGLMQNVASKATKYSFFDPTKEMTYIPADVEIQTKGKAAVDMVATRFSKSFGGFLQSTIFMLFPSIGFGEVAPYFMIVFIAICLLWLVDVKWLYAEYTKLLKQKS